MHHHHRTVPLWVNKIHSKIQLKLCLHVHYDDNVVVDMKLENDIDSEPKSQKLH